MEYSGRANNLFASIIGFFLITEGIWGLNSDTVFWKFTTNTAHAIIHILLGLTGMVLAWAGFTRGFNIFLGILLLAVGIFRFIPGVNSLVIELLNVNTAVACLNIVIGLVALIIAYVSKPCIRRRI